MGSGVGSVVRVRGHREWFTSVGSKTWCKEYALGRKRTWKTEVEVLSRRLK